jgi:rhodanese-related sulfurtransferase
MALNQSFFRWALLAASFACCTIASAAGLEMSAPDALEAAAKGKLKLIDIRTPDEWRETGVPKNASRLDMVHPRGGPGFVEDLLKQTGGDKTAPIALICRTGNRTTQVQRYLEAEGFTRVYNVKEGMAGSAAGPGWVKRGLPLENCRSC